MRVKFGYVSVNEITEIEQQLNREVKKITRKRTQSHHTEPMGYIEIEVIVRGSTA